MKDRQGRPLVPRLCESCETVVYWRRLGERPRNIRFTQEVLQSGMSAKYPNELATYCKDHH